MTGKADPVGASKGWLWGSSNPVNKEGDSSAKKTTRTFKEVLSSWKDRFVETEFARRSYTVLRLCGEGIVNVGRFVANIFLAIADKQLYGHYSLVDRLAKT